MTDQLLRHHRAVVQWLAIAAVALIVAAAGLTLLDVIMRSVVRRPLFGTNDVVILLLMVGILGSFPYCTATRQHLRVTAVGSWLGASGFWLLECLAGIGTLIILGGFVWQFGLRAIMLARTGEGSQILLIPMAPFWWLGAVLMAVAALAQCLLIVHDAGALIAGRPLPRASAGSPT